MDAVCQTKDPIEADYLKSLGFPYTYKYKIYEFKTTTELLLARLDYKKKHYDRNQ